MVLVIGNLQNSPPVPPCQSTPRNFTLPTAQAASSSALSFAHILKIDLNTVGVGVGNLQAAGGGHARPCGVPATRFGSPISPHVPLVLRHPPSRWIHVWNVIACALAERRGTAGAATARALDIHRRESHSVLIAMMTHMLACEIFSKSSLRVNP